MRHAMIKSIALSMCVTLSSHVEVWYVMMGMTGIMS